MVARSIAFSTPAERMIGQYLIDLVDEAAFVRHYKERYELPLKEIFE